MTFTYCYSQYGERPYFRLLSGSGFDATLGLELGPTIRLAPGSRTVPDVESGDHGSSRLSLSRDPGLGSTRMGTCLKCFQNSSSTVC